ncbi:MAG: NAD-dependent malic enzyme, partial [Tissierellia bacterium]|nr:NAD-dependent malic enzyme [Tissierellia bacterium]
IANMVKGENLKEDYIIPDALNKETAVAVAKSVEQAARDSGVAGL